MEALLDGVIDVYNKVSLDLDEAGESHTRPHSSDDFKKRPKMRLSAVKMKM